MIYYDDHDHFDGVLTFSTNFDLLNKILMVYCHFRDRNNINQRYISTTLRDSCQSVPNRSLSFCHFITIIATSWKKLAPVDLNMTDWSIHHGCLWKKRSRLGCVVSSQIGGVDAEFVLGVGKCAMSCSGWGGFPKMMLRWFCWNQLSLIGNTNWLWNDMLYCGCVSNMVGPYNSISEITVRLLWILRDPHGPSICAYTISNWTCNHELYQSFLFDLVVE